MRHVVKTSIRRPDVAFPEAMYSGAEEGCIIDVPSDVLQDTTQLLGSSVLQKQRQTDLQPPH
jgi:hypothetical protein